MERKERGWKLVWILLSNSTLHVTVRAAFGAVQSHVGLLSAATVSTVTVASSSSSSPLRCQKKFSKGKEKAATALMRPGISAKVKIMSGISSANFLL